MVDSGLVLKYFDIHASKCRVCVIPSKKFRELQLNAEREGKLDEFLLNLPIHPGSLDFGPSLCHFKIHIGPLMLDWGARRDFKKHGYPGYADDLKTGQQRVHDQLLKVLGIRVNEVRAGKNTVG